MRTPSLYKKAGRKNSRLSLFKLPFHVGYADSNCLPHLTSGNEFQGVLRPALHSELRSPALGEPTPPAEGAALAEFQKPAAVGAFGAETEKVLAPCFGAVG
jgi:hypothetical protein